MAAVKAQVAKRKLLGHSDVQLSAQDRSVKVMWAIVFVLLLAALSLLAYCLSVMLKANEVQVSLDGDTELYVRAPGCGYMSGVPKNVSRYVRYPDPSNPFLTGNRCAFVIYSETKEVRISFANYSFQPSSNAGIIVAELSDEGGNELKHSKLDYSRGLIAKVPSVIYYFSDGDEKKNSFVIEVSAIESSGSSTGIPERGTMMSYMETGAISRGYPQSAQYPMNYLAVLLTPPTSQPSRHFTCSPRNSTSCNAISLYRLPTFKLGDTASRLTGLSTGGVTISSDETVVLMFCLPSNFDASASGSTFLLEWHAVNETSMEIDYVY